MLERRGIISAYEGSKPRRVLIGEHDLERATSLARLTCRPGCAGPQQPIRVPCV